ncbi:hypothetical protein PV326_013227, partial [Microctonus aethiopoides]
MPPMKRETPDTAESLTGGNVPSNTQNPALGMPSTTLRIVATSEELLTEITAATGIPTWGLVAILIAVGVIVLGVCFCCIRRCFRKRRSKDGKKGLKGAVDLKSVQLLGGTYKDKVQPDMEELTDNAEEPDEAESKQSEVKLGKLQYK